MTTVDARAVARGKRIFRAQRARHRGYSIAAKALGIAIGIEIFIVLAGAASGWAFAVKYAGEPVSTQVAALGPFLPALHGLRLDFWMAILATVMISVAEIARIPLAMLSRIHGSRGIRWLALAGVIMMVLVTTKTGAQVLTQMFMPRIHAVQEIGADLNAARADLATVASQRGSADAALKPLRERVDQANDRIAEINRNIVNQGEAPRQQCRKVWHRNKRTGRQWSETKCSTPAWAGQQFVEQLAAANAERDAAIAARDVVASSVATQVERVASYESRVAELENEQRRVVSDSMVHALVAMIAGVDPLDVTDGQVHWAFRFLVLIPAFMIAAASTILAMAACTRFSKSREPLPIVVQLPAEIRKAQET